MGAAVRQFPAEYPVVIRPGRLSEPALTRGHDSARDALTSACGLPLFEFRREHVDRCVERWLEREGVPDEGGLAERLAVDGGARSRIRRAVAVSVSSLFRDAHQFELVERMVLPELTKGGTHVRVWSAGCADGAELYSVGLILERLGSLHGIRLLGTDLLPENIAVARQGVFGGQAVSPRVCECLRWEARDLVSGGTPAGEWNLVFCRNVSIYLSDQAKVDLHRSLASALAPGGFLVVGRSETLVDPGGLDLVRCAPHVYRRAS